MPSEVFNPVIIELAAGDETPVDPFLATKSHFLTTATSLSLSHLVCPAANDINTDNLGRLWGDIPPAADGYTVEMGTALPYYLPDLDGKPDYLLSVRGRELVVTSRMVQCFFSQQRSENSPLRYFLVHRMSLPRLVELQNLTHVHPVPLRTFVASRFSTLGENAHAILADNFRAWSTELATSIAAAIDAFRAVSPATAKHLLPQMSGPAFPIFWVYVQGADGRGSTRQFAGDVPQAAFRPLANVDKDAAAKVREILQNGGQNTTHESAMGLATVFVHYGYLGFALVQICIACESVLAQSYRAFLLARGVSKKKYEDAEKDIPYSHLLNLHLATICDVTELSKREEIIATLNWARKCRNEMVHIGGLKEQVTTGQVENAIDAAKSLIEFVLARTCR